MKKTNKSGITELVFILERSGSMMVIESRNSVNSRYFYTKAMIWKQIFKENLLIPIAMNIDEI